MYEYYEKNRHLNIKKVIIISTILILILLLIILFIARKISSPKNFDTETIIENNNTIYYSKDNFVSVELSNNFNLKKYESDYLLELRSENNLDIFISQQELMQNKELPDIVNADKIAYQQNFDSCSNISDVKELSINDNQAYTYSFHYLDSQLNKAFYLQIVWMQINDKYYIFDIEFPLDDLAFNTNLVSAVLASFKVNN